LKIQKPAKKESKKEVAAAKASSAKKKSKEGDEEGSKKKRQKKKKDPNAPKRAMSGFMFFSNAEREVSCMYLGSYYFFSSYGVCGEPFFFNSFLPLCGLKIFLINKADNCDRLLYGGESFTKHVGDLPVSCDL